MRPVWSTRWAYSGPRWPVFRHDAGCAFDSRGSWLHDRLLLLPGVGANHLVWPLLHADGRDARAGRGGAAMIEDGKPVPPTHPASESKRKIFLHSKLPVIIGVAWLIVSLCLDLWPPGAWWAGRHWTQRSGSILTVLGVYVAYFGSKQMHKFVDGDYFLNLSLKYPIVGAVMTVVGTIIWGYADIWL
jgi:hypothetical protein